MWTRINIIVQLCFKSPYTKESSLKVIFFKRTFLVASAW